MESFRTQRLHSTLEMINIILTFNDSLMEYNKHLLMENLEFTSENIAVETAVC